QQLRRNTYDPNTGTVTISQLRADAVAALSSYYSGLFADDPAREPEREAYAIPANAVSDPQRLHDLSAFFFWASWACVTERPSQQITYTNNWPPEPLVGNLPSSSLVLWTGFSVILLLAGIG